MYKWKPPLENTIDLMIKIPDVDRQLVSSLNCELRAYNNYDDSRVELRSIAKILGGGATRNDERKNYVVFARQDFLVTDLEGVKNGDVWEFNFEHIEDSDETQIQNGQIRITTNKMVFGGSTKNGRIRLEFCTARTSANKTSMITTFPVPPTLSKLRTVFTPRS